MNKKERNLKKISELKDFSPKFYKNIIIDFAHGQSDIAHTAACQICSKTAHTAKQLKNYRNGKIPHGGYGYGISFGRFRNKRHATRPEHNKDWLDYNYFTNYICRECIENIEKVLDFTFKKSYAP